MTRDPLATASRELARVLAARRDHAAFLGLETRRVSGGLTIRWRDSYNYEGGVLTVIPRHLPTIPIVSALLTELDNWRKQTA